MPPKFIERSFLFADGEEVPDHTEEFPRNDERDMGMWYLEGLDAFSNETYPLATDIDTEEDALRLAAARLRRLEVTQPTIESGGQGGDSYDGGIQDRVYITPPKEFTGVRFNPPQSELFGD